MLYEYDIDVFYFDIQISLHLFPCGEASAGINMAVGDDNVQLI